MNAPAAQVTLNTAFRYVLILEWLNEDDQPTGEQLHNFLQQLGIPSVLVRCGSAEDVRDALVDAHAHIRERGAPAVHLETHAVEPGDDNGGGLQFGTNAAPGMTWFELGDWLAPLNVASGFRLMVVGAACFGLGVMAAMKVYAHPAPFAICIGMTTSVSEGSLRGAMFELYRSLRGGETMQGALAAANRELRAAHEELRMTSSPVLAYQICRGVYDGYRTPETMDVRVAGLLDRAKEAGLPTPESFANALPQMLRDRGQANMQLAWDTWFPPDLQARDANFQFNYGLVEI